MIMKELKLQKLLGVIASAFKNLKNIVFFGNNTKYPVGGKFKKLDNKQDLIDINTIDITNLKTIDDVLDYVNKVGKERFTNESIEKLSDRIKTINWFINNYPNVNERHEELYNYCFKQSHNDYDYFIKYKIDYLNYIDECCIMTNGYSIINGNCCYLDKRTDIRQLLN